MCLPQPMDPCGDLLAAAAAAAALSSCCRTAWVRNPVTGALDCRTSTARCGRPRWRSFVLKKKMMEREMIV